MGKSQRDKGARWEREVAKAMTAVGLEAKRGLVQARSASEGADVECAGWWPECKHWKEPATLRALEQAEEASRGSGLRPVAICKADRRTPTATWRETIAGVELVVTADFSEWLTMAAQTARRQA
jgi:hypothetical protein